MPKDLKTTVIGTMYKGKGERIECSGSGHDELGDFVRENV